ncbi:hypothetical protein C8R46DRAFT_923577, partial [Mycena filopes]
CLGVKFSWNLGDIFDTYPFSIHRPGSTHDPGYIILFVDPIAAVICVRATRCQQAGSNPGGSSRSCMELCINSVRDHALKPFGKKPTARLNCDQLEQKLAAVRKQLKNEQLKVGLAYLFNAFKSETLARKLFFDVISTNTIPGLCRLLHNAKTAGWSIEKTAQMALKALRGDYHARNYPDFDKDLAILIYELGGGAASTC